MERVGQKSFLEEVVERTPGGEKLYNCIQCGSCGGSCPNGVEMDYSPRALFALIAAGERERVLSSNTMWLCVSCYFCTTRCPKEIPITDIMYTLKELSLKEGLASNKDAVSLAKTFNEMIDQYGRSFEFGLATRYYFAHKSISSAFKAGLLGLKMFTRGRIHLKPQKIEQLEQLKSILKRADEIEENR